MDIHGFVYMLALISISNSHRDKIDVGNVEINIKEYPTYDTTRHAQLTVLAQNSDCWKCPFIEIGHVSPVAGNRKNVTIHANHTTHLKLTVAHEENSSTHLLCAENVSASEHAYYQWIVRSSGDQIDNVSCEFVTKYSGVDGYMPILYMFVVMTGLALLWIVGKQIYQRRVGFISSSQGESLVRADLGTGSTNTLPNQETEQKRKPNRLKSLDVFRGLSLTIMIFVNYGGGKYWFFAHSSWNGLTVADLVFPWFIFIMGTALAFVFSSHHKKGKSKLKLLLQIIIRCVKLFVLGLMVNTAGGRGNDLNQLRIPGVLQRFSLTYLIVAVTELVFAGGYIKQIATQDAKWYHRLRDVIYFWPNWTIAILLLLIEVIVTFFVPYNMSGCPTGYVGPGGISEDGRYFNCTGGVHKYIDLMVFSYDHIYQHGTCKNLYQCAGTDPEGLLGTLSSIFLCFLGVQAGRILVVYSSVKDRVFRWLIWAVGLGTIALILSHGSQNEGWIPINKNLWSASFVIALGSMAFLLLSFLYLVIDVKEIWSGAPFIYPGMNSIFVYVGSETLEDLIPISFAVSQTHLAQLFINLWSTAFWVIVAAYMYYKDIFISV